MEGNAGTTRRIVAVAILAVAVLAGLFIASGGSLPGGGSSSSPPASGAGAGSPTPAPSGKVQGTLTASARHLVKSAWEFSYTIHNTGKVPIAGLQINGGTSNLYDITNQRLWSFFGAGVCNKGPSGILIYWSTGLTSPTLIKPGDSLTFRFKSRTARTVQDTYSFSWGSATPQFGRVTAPAPSTLSSPQKCTK